ncbi:YsnF/AvaK domain-containing protein [Methylobacterium iners]|uniref:DUF2382 domain-containing protein n=1 Tax=Methylobacterium iners TaxID=418707 RepID=A0ABQ4S0W0_9HYPH|nr:YsnF/AvaK domain-containing protein [Methylobacterium iners]GJD96109.1 hypothetical protein OCOJLMKI_3327 [Methylobacterium iners]
MNGGDAGSTLGVAKTTSTDQSETGERDVIALVAETARIDKRVVKAGRVRVSTRTEVSEETLRETLRSDAVGVTRVPIDRIVADGDPMPQVRMEGGLTIIPVLEEILVVEKRLVLKEELHMRRTSSVEDVEVPVAMRKQHAVVERSPPASDMDGASRKETDA